VAFIAIAHQTHIGQAVPLAADIRVVPPDSSTAVHSPDLSTGVHPPDLPTAVFFPIPDNWHSCFLPVLAAFSSAGNENGDNGRAVLESVKRRYVKNKPSKDHINSIQSCINRVLPSETAHRRKLFYISIIFIL
jgi:hypothetical protein